VRALAEIIVASPARGIAVLLIEHDMHSCCPLAQRVVVLNFRRQDRRWPAARVAQIQR